MKSSSDISLATDSKFFSTFRRWESNPSWQQKQKTLATDNRELLSELLLRLMSQSWRKQKPFLGKPRRGNDGNDSETP